MDIRLVRIDSRLLHGQVTTDWVRALAIKRILIVSDTVAHDNMRRLLIQQAAPMAIQTHVLTIAQMTQLLSDTRFKDEKVMIITESPDTVCQLVKVGMDIHSVNVGSLSFSHGKQMITDAVAVDKHDIAVFEWFHRHHIAVEVRKVSHDKAKDLWKILRDKKLVEVNESK